MTRHAVDTACCWASSHWASVQVLLTEAPEGLVRPWLGGQIRCGRQAEGDLGDRMHDAFAQAFREGEKRVVLIGTDCPGITPQILQRAFDALLTNDAVFGPALDGGYYLVGLRRATPSLFQGPQWGTDEVLRQTLGIAREQELSVAQLEPLGDVDRPEDLAIWNGLPQRISSPDPGRLAVVVPCLNEADSVGDAVRSAVGEAEQVIVVDGGSTDGTREQARRAGAIVLRNEDGRAMQQNAGAVGSNAGTLLFLHGDSRLPAGYAEQVQHALGEEDVVAGAFHIGIEGSFPGRALEERMVNRRARARQLPYGDQGLFVRREVFLELGGFPDQPIMEDYELVRRLRRHGRVVLAPGTVTTSGRRWEQHGIVKTTLINQLMLLAYYLGVSPERLARWYRG
jgi:hypothetical protein